MGVSRGAGLAEAPGAGKAEAGCGDRDIRFGNAGVGVAPLRPATRPLLGLVNADRLPGQPEASAAMLAEA